MCVASIETKMRHWGKVFGVALFVDLFLLETLNLVFNCLLLLIVGASPDACGFLRNFWLATATQAVLDNVK
jgi:hypothetical protein